MPAESIRSNIAPYTVGPGRLVTAPSYLIDRFVPDCEIICLPAKEVAGGVFSVGRRQGELAPPAPDKLRKRLLLRKPEPQSCDRLIFDFRLRSPQNWAHFLNNHLPIFFHACDVLGVAWDETCLLLPDNTPGYIRDLAALFGLNTLCTDAVVTGEGAIFEADPWTGIRPARFEWVKQPQVEACLDKLRAPAPLPKQVFLSRKTTRNLSNASEVEAYLSARGFVTLYPEDLSAADQMRLFQEAEMIVAIHGAALAPLLYHRAHHALRRIIEILPCGHMTDVYRVMAHQVGCDWIGVRGRLKAKYIAPAYDFEAGFSEFSLDDFHVDLASLEQAFALSGETLNDEK